MFVENSLLGISIRLLTLLASTILTIMDYGNYFSDIAALRQSHEFAKFELSGCQNVT